MAGIKVTDLPVLATPATDDVLYIVDTSTNTSKQISVEDATSLSIPLAGTTQMGAAEITHTSTGKTANVGFVDGSVYLTATGADGGGTVSAGEDTTIIQYDAAVSGYSSSVLLSDGLIDISINGTVIQGEWDGDNQKLAFFGSTPVVKAAAIADPTDLASLLTALPSLLAAMRAYGLIAE
jgi:prepilin-type processing-associated H-X9-DG protein